MATPRIVRYQPQNYRTSLFDVYFYSDRIHTMVTSDPNMVTQWIYDIETFHRRRLHHLIVGLDVEWRPSFSRYYQNPVAILQLCVGRRCLIFQLRHCPFIPQSLADFLANRSYTFVGVRIGYHKKKLLRDRKLSVGNVVNLRWLVADTYGLSRNAGLKELCHVALRREIDKPRYITAGNWGYRWLKRDQIKYACVDAFIHFEMGRRLLKFSGNMG